MKALIALLIMALVAPPAARAQDASQREKLGFGMEGFPVPEQETVNATAPRTVQLLGEAMHRARGADRVKLVADIGACELPEGLPYLQEAMADTDPLVRTEAARSAGRINAPAALPGLAKLLDDSAASVRAAAVTASAALGDAGAVDKGLADADVGVLSAAVEAATTPQHADAIALRLPDLPTTSLKLRALAALGRIGAPANGQVIASQIGKQPALTVAAIRTLGRLKATGQSNAVLEALNHEHPTVRREAVLALPSVTDAPTQQQRAIAMLADGDSPVREAAATVLQGVPTTQAIEPLVEQLSREYRPLHDAARQALVAIGKDAIPAAERLLTDANPRLREDGSYLLGQLKSDAGFAQHLKLLEDEDWRVVEQAARSLGQIGRADAADELTAVAVNALRWGELVTPDTDRTEGAAINAAITQAIVAAAKLGHRPVLDPLIPIIPKRDHFSASHRAATIWAYGVLTETADPAIAGRFPAMYADEFEAYEVKFEAIKASGNLRYKPAKGFLERVISEADSLLLSWVANWAHNQVTGEDKVFIPPPAGYRADVAVFDDTVP